MLKRFRSHFCHNLIAYLALFFALGGTAIAAKPLITGADVQDGSLTGADVSDASTLKGVDIDESDLGKVPSAANADNAANADKLDGKDASELGPGATYVFTHTFVEVDGKEVAQTITLPQGDWVVEASVPVNLHNNGTTDESGGVQCALIPADFAPADEIDIKVVSLSLHPGDIANLFMQLAIPFDRGGIVRVECQQAGGPSSTIGHVGTVDFRVYASGPINP